MQFDFGQNWTDFARAALTGERVEAAQKEFAALLEGVPLRDASVLDVGFGQGLSLLSAARSGSRALGCDINPKCRDALRVSAAWFPEVEPSRIPIVTPQELLEGRPDDVLALPWNIADEIAAILQPMREWDGRMVIAVPRLTSRPV